MTDQDNNAVTLGEVNRAVERIVKEVADLTKAVSEKAVADAIQGEKINRLERIVYGALGVAGAALITAIITAVVAIGMQR